MAVNFSFFMPPADPRAPLEIFPGINYRFLKDNASTVAVPLPTLIVGPTPLKQSQLARWAKQIPADVKDRPDFSLDKIVHGSVIDQQVGDQLRKVAVGFQDETGTEYILIRLGLQYTGSAQNKSMTNHLMDILGAGITPMQPCVFSFHRQAVKDAAHKLEGAQDDDTIHSIMGNNTTIRMSNVAAERINIDESGGKHVAGLTFRATDWSLWKMPPRSVLIGRDMNGRHFRIVTERKKLRPVDANAKEYIDFVDVFYRAGQKKAAEEARKTFDLPANHPDR